MTFLQRLVGELCPHRFAWPRLSDNGQHDQICLVCGTAYASATTRRVSNASIAFKIRALTASHFTPGRGKILVIDVTSVRAMAQACAICSPLSRVDELDGELTPTISRNRSD
jgi:hypothetical protein